MPWPLPVLILTWLLVAAPVASAAESARVASPRGTATLVADADSVGAGEGLRIGLRLRLAPGWHTYWRNPGDAGAPAEIALTLPDGATAGPIEWPVPERIPYGPLVNYGYTGEVLLPMRITPPASAVPGGLLRIEADATWLACAQVCIPEEGRFRLDLPVAAGGGVGSADARLAPLFDAAEAAQPRPLPWTARAALPAAGRPGSLTLAGEALSPATVRAAEFFPDDPGVLDNAAPQALIVRDGVLTLALTRPEGADAPAPATLSGVLALTDRAGVRAAYAVQAPVAAAGGPASAPGLWPALAWAFLGGLILNLMPCVFPVLAMKAMALARLSGAAGAEVRSRAASYTAGVMATFLLLGGALVALRSAGVAAGWGFQFTAPAFVALLAWLMLAVGLNLSGVFGVGGAAGPGAGGALAARGGHLGSFATGALAVLVATPCTAPFMAAAVGAALAMPPAAALAVFAALGLGLAAPTALLGLWPGLARALPRPGPWMERLRQALAFPMYAAAAWLAWVLAQQAGPEGLAFVLAGAVLVGFAAWALGVAQRSAGRRGRGLGRATALAAAFGALALLPGLAAAPPRDAAAEAAAGDPAAADAAEPWTAARVAALQAEGRAVFVNLTAAWCITCQVNERLALRRDAVRTAFAERGVALLKGDWTGGDAAIGALLREHGREGVPLYLLYPPGGGPPRILPQVLTEGIVLRALADA